MLPLTIDDLLPLEEFASRRKEFFDAQRRYVDRYRRVRIGPRLTLIFENRQTLWFRVQEIVRVARLYRPTSDQGKRRHRHDRRLVREEGSAAVACAAARARP